jgi:hypothetical protein
MKDSFKKCAHCAGSGVAGVALSHLGCIAAPIGMTAIGLAGGAVGGAASIAIGAAFTAAGLGLWYGLRGRHAPPLERKLVIGSALAGFALMTVFNCAGGGHEHHHHHMQMEKKEVSGNAKLLHMSAAEYLRSICISNKPT